METEELARLRERQDQVIDCIVGPTCSACRVAREQRARRIELERKDAANAAYTERNRCVALLAALARENGHFVWWNEHSKDDETWDPDWLHIIFIQLTTGQVSWHVSNADFEKYFSWVPFEATMVWDHHTTEQKYERVQAQVNLLQEYWRGAAEEADRTFR